MCENVLRVSWECLYRERVIPLPLRLCLTRYVVCGLLHDELSITLNSSSFKNVELQCQDNDLIQDCTAMLLDSVF